MIGNPRRGRGCDVEGIMATEPDLKVLPDTTSPHSLEVLHRHLLAFVDVSRIGRPAQRTELLDDTARSVRRERPREQAVLVGNSSARLQGKGLVYLTVDAEGANVDESSSVMNSEVL